MNTESLREIGLAGNEIKVYLTLLELGSSLVSKIAVESGVHRRNGYDALHKLAEKGLVTSVIIRGKRYFQPTHPEKLIGFIEEQECILEDKKDKIKQLIPELLTKFKHPKSMQEAEIIKGKEGLKTLLLDILKVGKDLFAIGATGDVLTEVKYSFANLEKKRVKARIRYNLLVDYGLREHPITKLPFIKYKVLPKECKSKVVTWIYGDRVVNVLWKEEPVAFMIKKREIAEHYMKYFHLLWKIAKK